MANIPTIPGTAQVQTVGTGVKMNVGPRLAALAGVRQVAEAASGAIGQAAEALTAYENKKYQAEQTAVFNQASIQMRTATAAYREQIAKNADYNSYVPEWQKQAQGVRESILNNPLLKGVARKQMIQALDGWQAETNLEFQHAADVRGTQSRKTLATLAAERAYQDGNLKAGDAAIDGAVRTGDMWPDAGAVIKQTGRRTAELSMIETGIRVDPARTLQAIDAGKFKNVTQHQLETARIQARAQVARNQTDNLSNLYEELNANPAMMTNERITQAEKTGQISALGAQRLKNARDMQEHRQARDKYNVLMMQVHDHDFSEDKVPEEQAREFHDQAAGLPAEFARPLMNEINSKLQMAKKSAQAAEQPVQTQVFNLMKEQRMNFGTFVPMHQETTHTGGFLGFGGKTETRPMAYGKGLGQLLQDLQNAKPEDLEAAYGKGATPQSVVEAEQANYAKTFIAMKQWFASPQGQKATYDQAKAHLEQLEMPQKAGGAMAALQMAQASKLPSFSADDTKAWQWAQANSDDPRAKEIYSKIMAKYHMGANETPAK